MSRIGREYTRLTLQEMDEASRGLPRLVTRSAALRRLEHSVTNLYSLSVETEPAGTDPAAAPLRANEAQQTSQGFVFVEGYSAAPGSPAAAPDATGRGGDRLIGLRSGTASAARAHAAMVVLSPMAALAYGVALGVATLVVRIPFAATSASVGMGTASISYDGEVSRLGTAISAARGTATIAVKWAQTANGISVARGTATLSAAPVWAGIAKSVAHTTARIAVKRSMAATGNGVAVGSATLSGAGEEVLLGGTGISLARGTGLIYNSMAETPEDFVP